MIRTIAHADLLGARRAVRGVDRLFLELTSRAMFAFSTRCSCGARGLECGSQGCASKPSVSTGSITSRSYIFMTNHVSNLDPPIRSR